MPDTLDPVVEDPEYVKILTYEHLKNYRFLIVEQSTLEPKQINQ